MTNRNSNVRSNQYLCYFLLKLTNGINLYNQIVKVLNLHSPLESSSNTSFLAAWFILDSAALIRMYDKKGHSTVFGKILDFICANLRSAKTLFESLRSSNSVHLERRPVQIKSSICHALFRSI